MTARTSTLPSPSPSPSPSTQRAGEARRAVLRAELATQRRALAAREDDLQRALGAARASASSDAAALRSLRLSVAWHRESLERLAVRLAA